MRRQSDGERANGETAGKASLGKIPLVGDNSSADADDDALYQFVRAHPSLLVLGGAGCSTASGLGDYRDRDGNWKRRQPITGQTFIGDPLARARYWARSAVGWPAFSQAEPSQAHRALAELEQTGLLALLITQNVDGLHQRAGHQAVLELHGTLTTVSCIDCRHCESRDDFQIRLLRDNPWLAELDASYAPDGDADLELAAHDAVCVPGCACCGGLLKPDVVFFGENVPRMQVAFAMTRLREADALLVAGSSLMVYSGYRFCRDAAERGQPIVIVNDGRTRADELAALKIGGDCGARLARLVSRIR